MSVITVTKVYWKKGEELETPYKIEIKDLEGPWEEDYAGRIMFYTKKGTWHKYDGGTAITIKESVEELEKLAGREWLSIKNMYIKRPWRKESPDYDNYNEYGAESEYDSDERWERLSEEGIYED